MKKILFLLFFSISCFQLVSAKEFDAVWCTENGGTLNYDVKISCATKDINEPLYLEKIYSSLCMPYYTYIFNNKPLFLKITVFENNKARFLTDEFNWKIEKSELLKYI